jgi:hypothetical protein
MSNPLEDCEKALLFFRFRVVVRRARLCYNCKDFEGKLNQKQVRNIHPCNMPFLVGALWGWELLIA